MTKLSFLGECTGSSGEQADADCRSVWTSSRAITMAFALCGCLAGAATYGSNHHAPQILKNFWFHRGAEEMFTAAASLPTSATAPAPYSTHVPSSSYVPGNCTSTSTTEQKAYCAVTAEIQTNNPNEVVDTSQPCYHVQTSSTDLYVAFTSKYVASGSGEKSYSRAMIYLVQSQDIVYGAAVTQ